VAVGAGIRGKEGNLIPVSVKEGDTVLLPDYGGTQVKLGDKEYVLFLLPSILSYNYKLPYLCIYDDNLILGFGKRSCLHIVGDL
jgi:hypothetical protein